MQYVIYNRIESDIQGEPMYWSNDWGWVSFPEATVFKLEDIESYLPGKDSQLIDLDTAFQLYKLQPTV